MPRLVRYLLFPPALSYHPPDIGLDPLTLDTVRTHYRSQVRGASRSPNPQLAAALKTLSIRLWILGLHPQSAEAAEECVALYRGLARDQPDVYNPILAETLEEFSHRPLGLSVAQECADLYRDLAMREPRTFRPKLAMVLETLAAHRRRLGDHDGAREDAEQCEKNYRDL